MFILYIHIFKIDRTKLLYIAISQVWECLGISPIFKGNLGNLW